VGHTEPVPTSALVLWASFHPLSPLFSGICKSKDIFNKLSLKCCNSAFNAQDSRLITVVVQLVRSTVKIYVAAVEVVLRKKERQDETQFTTKIDGFLEFQSPVEC
jgi:hypothetical protein